MKGKLFLGSLLFFSFNCPAQSDSLFIRKIADEILVNGKAYENLRGLTKTIGARLSGSPQMYKAEEWGLKQLQENGSQRTYKQECFVPHWVRGGKDMAAALLPGNKKRALNVLALGNTEGTGAAGLTAQVIMVSNFDELEARKAEVKGKIVFYNYPFNPRFIKTFEGYGDAVRYRSRGTYTAAKYGAVASMVRSISHSTDNHPHTGGTRYDTAYKKIPAIAVGLKDADWLAGELEKQGDLKVYIRTLGRMLPEVKGNNLIGELKGSELPDEIITVGAHLDSWDVGEGAHDDGSGVTQTIEVLRTFTALGYQPKRTIRFVLFANEENGVRGGAKYAEEAAKATHEKHIFALESDAGGFVPRGFGITASKEKIEKLNSWLPLVHPYGVNEIIEGEGGVDITPLHTQLGTPMTALLPDSQRYFDIHHADSDVFEAVNKRELELGAVNMAALIYLVDQYGF